MFALVNGDTGPRLETARPTPVPGPDDALIRVDLAGVCQTDLELARGYMGFTGVLGHEFVGTVEHHPDPAWVGRRVVGEINCPCLACPMCRGGLPGHCPHRTVLGILGRDGCLAHHVALPARNLHHVPDVVTDDEAVFTEPLAAAFQVKLQLGRSVTPASYVTVLGDGRLGLLVAQVLHDEGKGPKVRVVGRHEPKLGLCERWGVKARHLRDVRPRHDQQVVVDCTGNAAGVEIACAMLRPRGTLVLKTTLAPSPDNRPVDLSPVVVDELVVVGSRCGPFGPALSALAEARVDVTSLIGRRMVLRDGPAVLSAAAERGMLKVLVSPR